MLQDDSRKKRVLKTARALIYRDGTAFTVASLCEECGLSRSAFRRLFSTRAKLLATLAHEVTEKAKPGAAASQAQETRDVWLERRFRVLERAINSLEARLDANALRDMTADLPGNVQDTAEVARLVAFMPDMPGTVAGAVMTSEPEMATAEAVIATQATVTDIDTGASPNGFDERDAAVEFVPMPDLPPVIEAAPLFDGDIPHCDCEPENQEYTADDVAALDVENDPTCEPLAKRDVMRTLLNKVRAAASMVAEVESAQRSLRLERQKMMIFGAAAVLVFVLAIGVVSRYQFSHVAQKTAQNSRPADKAVHAAPPVTIINATGADDLSGERFKSITRQAARGDARSQSRLALAYLRGDGVSADPAAAIGWSRMAAAQGEPSAQFILATLYASGVKPDPQLALRWLAAAASRGNMKAMHNLALAYLNGIGVPRNTAAALTWFGKAASSGYRDSAFDLAVLYERGESVPQNPQLAIRWYTAAASEGDREAAQRIELLKTQLPRLALQR